MVDRELHGGDHMSDFEALMWNLDKDPRLSSTIANISMLDRPPDMTRLRARMERAAIVIPRLRQRVVPALGRLAPPAWRYDHQFDIDHHVRRISLGRGASNRELFDLAMTLVGDPFDRTRPLWEFVVIDGLRGGRSAMLQRLHHTLTDGKGGLRISEQFVDLERDAVDPPPLDPPDLSDDDDSFLGTVAETVGHIANRQAGVAKRAATDALRAITSPLDSLGSTRHLIETTGSAFRQARLTDTHLSPVWDGRSLSRRFDAFDVPLAAAKGAASALGGSVNDFFVTGAAAAAGAYHRKVGTPVEHLRMAMPISTRTDRSAGGNMFSPSQTVVPTGVMTPAERFALVHDLLGRTRAEPALNAVEAVANAVNLLPTSVLIRTGVKAAESIDFVTSNLRAAPFDVFIAGALMESNYPIGPIASTAFNLTTMSYRGTLNMGVVIDTAAVSDPALLVNCLKAAFRELVRAAG